MKAKKELPLVEPIFSTYHNAIFSACIKDNPTIRNIYLNEIDQYNKYLKELKNCKKLDVTICDGKNGSPTTYDRHGMEVKAIINAYENHIEVLCHRIAVMIWIEVKP